MMRPKKIEVNIWSDQLTPDFETHILVWSDQIRVCKSERADTHLRHSQPRQETPW
jgi:hypothetical protein